MNQGRVTFCLATCLTLVGALAACGPAPSISASPAGSVSVEQVVERFGLEEHPEGGYYREIYKSDLEVEHPAVPDGNPANRSASSAIYFLLAPGEFSAFHRIRWTDEVWHFYAGDPVEQHVIHSDGRHESWILSGDLDLADPVSLVPAGALQAARVVPGGRWALVGCTVAPGFDFAEFELPSAAELIAEYPQHEGLIRELTRH